MVSFSLDDFYLSRDNHERLSNIYKDNKLLEFRGNPGTHDLRLLNETLERLIKSNCGIVLVPTYCKIAHGGLGDRNPQRLWNKVELPVDVILFEGWMLGFRPLDLNKLLNILTQDYSKNHSSEYLKAKGPIPRFQLYPTSAVCQINDKLGSYCHIWDQFDSMVMLYPDDLESIYNWRWEQELSGGLNYDQVCDFVDRFMPAYELYLKNACVYNAHLLKITLDIKRNVKSWKLSNNNSK